MTLRGNWAVTETNTNKSQKYKYRIDCKWAGDTIAGYRSKVKKKGGGIIHITTYTASYILYLVYFHSASIIHML